MQLYSEKAENFLNRLYGIIKLSHRQVEVAACLALIFAAPYGVNVFYNFNKGVSLRDKISAVELRLSTEETSLEARAHAGELIKSNRQELMESREKMTNPFYNLF